MNDKERHKYDVIGKVVNGEITRKDAAYELDLSREQIYRLIIIYKSEGENGFVHKNRGRSNINKTDEKYLDKIKDTYVSDYDNYSLTHFLERSEFDISYTSLYTYFRKNNIISPYAHKNTVKAYEEKMNESIQNGIATEKEITLFRTRLLEHDKAHVRRSSNFLAFGEEVQVDACVKIWFGNIPCYLHLAVDRSTKKVLFGWFEYEELTRGYFVLLFNIIINYGIPKKITSDNRSTFSANNVRDKKNKLNLTQFANICNTLGIELQTSSNPLFKPNVERENGTFERRLIAELKHEGINDIDIANKYLNTEFIPYMNENFSYEINEETSMMKPNNYSEEELKLIISEKYNRIIDNASSISFNNKYYVPVDPDSGEIVSYSNKTKCIFIISYDGDTWSEIENKYYRMKEVESRDLLMRKEKDVPKEEKKEHIKYVPPADHPWRKFKIKN